jgi:hypothetical protein
MENLISNPIGPAPAPAGETFVIEGVISELQVTYGIGNLLVKLLRITSPLVQWPGSVGAGRISWSNRSGCVGHHVRR